MIKQKSIENVDMLKGLNFVAIISLMGWGLGYFGQPHILARFMAADSHHTIVHARRISMAWMILCLAGACAVGFFGIAYFNNNPAQAGAVNQNAERVFIELAQVLFNPWIAGILMSAILAAVMSTLSCQLLVCSSAITEDLYKAFLRKGASQKELVWVGRFMVLVVALVAIALAANPENRVLGLVSYAWAGFGAAFWSGGALLGTVVAHDPQRRAGGDDYRCGHRHRLETVRVAGPVRNHSGLYLRQHRHCGVQSAWQGTGLLRCKKRFAEADAHYHSAPPSKLQAE
ncbi:sodium/proline symporter [Enterobacter cancerogenus]|uniref:Sodium/proline symporter n=1 Tax=Enterobacter cancerogenus TaxID=69218 RepID=A0A484X8P5_9ENTR|nr:sodium/proline symporter [Enterobacter cancerogenus]